MQFADQAAVITGLGKKSGDQGFVIREIGIAIAMHMVAGRVATGQKRGPAWGADLALHIGALESNPARDQAIQIGGADV